jgi:MFS family permease
MSRVVAVGRRTFSALSILNYRRYFIGQAISLVGTWMQAVANSWLVYVITHSATDVGVAVAAQTIPILVLGPYGGVIADRVDKRRLMVVLQIAMGVQALVLGLLTVTGVVRYWEVLALAVILGLNNAFENPTRQTFILEMVGPDELRNAVSLNSTLFNAARAVGPAAAGLLIAAVGTGWCFLINAASFAAVVYSLVTLDKTALTPSPPARREKGQVREGFRYVRRTPRLLIPLVMMGIIGMLAYEFQVVLPVVAKGVFHGGPQAYGFETAAIGAGAIVGGLVTATRGSTGLRPFTIGSVVFGLTIAVAAIAPTLGIELLALGFVGWASITFASTGNATLQLEADPSMRGRVMSLWAVAFLGTTPVGGPLIGWIMAESNGRVGLAVGAASCFVAAGLGAGWMLARGPQRTRKDLSPMGASDSLETDVTSALGGPTLHQATMASTASLVPSKTASTEPSSRLRIHP